LKFDPGHGSLPQYLACCFVRLRRFGDAVRYSDRETAMHAERNDPRIRLALSQWCDGQQESAIQSLRDGISLQPEQVEWHFQLGVLLAAREEHEAAARALRHVIGLKPDHAAALFHLALCCGALNEPLEAVRLLSQAQRFKPHDARIALFLAMASSALSGTPAVPALRLTPPVAMPAVDIEDIEELTIIVRHEPEVVEAFVRLPAVGHDTDIFELLSAVLERAVLREPMRAELHYHQAQIYRRLGKSDLAIASCERAIEIEPKLVQALVTLAKLYLDTDRRMDAQARFQQVLDLGYEYADVHFQLGCIYREQGEKQQAEESYRKALQINSSYGAALEALESLAA
jgi:tetratricopeptide (TPR) repeat protein